MLAGVNLGAASALLRRLAFGLEELGDVADALRNRSGSDPVALVVGELNLTATVGFGDRRLHRVGDPVGVHQHGPVNVARSATDRLDQRRLAAQEAFLVGVENCDQRHLRDV